MAGLACHTSSLTASRQAVPGPLRHCAAGSRACNRVVAVKARLDQDSSSKQAANAAKRAVIGLLAGVQLAALPFADLPAAAVPASILGGRDFVDEATSKDNANTPSAGSVSRAASNLGSSLADKLPNAPDISNPLGSEKLAGSVGSSQLPSKIGEAASNVEQAGKAAAGAKQIGQAANNVLGDTASLADDAKVLGGKDVQPDVKGAQNLPQAGGLSKKVSEVGESVAKKLPNPPDLSNPKGSAESNFPTIPKVLQGK